MTTTTATRTDDIDPIAIAEELEELLAWPGDGRVYGTWVADRPVIVVLDPEFPWAADAGDVARFLESYDGMTGEEYRDAYGADLFDDPYHVLCSDVDELGVVDGDGPDADFLVEVYRDEGVVLTVMGSQVLAEPLLAVLAADEGDVARAVAVEIGVDMERVRVEPQDVRDHEPHLSSPVATAYVQGLAEDFKGDEVEVEFSVGFPAVTALVTLETT